MEQFKIRASAGGKLLTNAQGKSNEEKYNDTVNSLLSAKARLDEFKNKDCKSAIEIREVKIPNLEKTYDYLLPIRHKLEMGETAKSYIKEWFISQITGKTKDIKSKYLARGNDMESQAIERVAKHYGVELIKNEIYLENEWFTGTFDTEIKDVRVIDTKVPFDCFTFPYFVAELDSDYYAQLQIYMNLTGLRKASVAYCLENGSDEQIEKISWIKAKEKEKDEPDIEEWEEAELELSYDHLPDNLRIKVFEIEYDEPIIEKLKARVLEAREYVKGLELILNK